MKPTADHTKSPYHNKWATCTVSKDVKDYSNDPAVIKKTQEAIKFLEKVGLPEELLKLRDAQYGKK
jgi:hypothetical protein